MRKNKVASKQTTAAKQHAAGARTPAGGGQVTRRSAEIIWSTAKTYRAALTRLSKR